MGQSENLNRSELLIIQAINFKITHQPGSSKNVHCKKDSKFFNSEYLCLF
jgi:hypothetical protein